MKNEKKRLETFVNWPDAAPIDASRVARGGFFYNGTGLSVTCFSCRGTISHWDYGDIVIKRHKELNPQCDFVLGKSDNVTPNHAQARKRDEKTWKTFSMLLTEEERLKTFVGWPLSFVSVGDLAATGFFYLRDGDKVQCVFCNTIVGDWERGDAPNNEHVRHSRSCPFLKGYDVGNVPISPNAHFTPTSTWPTIGTLGVTRLVGPKHPYYADYHSRLRTYMNWPSVVPKTPHSLCQAGLFYAGEFLLFFFF